jgi:hypothetical protein
MKKRYTEEQFIGFPHEAGAGLPITELCRKHGFSAALPLSVNWPVMGEAVVQAVERN